MTQVFKIIRRSEILLHNKPTDCWFIIKNSVYDLSGFIAMHPGGMDVLLSRAGEDASSYFMLKHGNDKRVLQRLESFKIGELPPEESVTVQDEDEPFLMELLRRCHAEKLFSENDRTSQVHLIRVLNVIIFFIASFLVLYTHLTWFFAIPLLIIQALCGTSLFGFLAHESIHRNIPKSPLGKLALSIVWPVFWPFISQKPLLYEHNSHHIKIGDPEHDFEVAAFASVLRYSGLVEHKPIHRLQHHWALFIYPFYANIITTIGGVKSGFWKAHNRDIALLHLLSVVATMLYFLVIPAFFVHSIGLLILYYLIYQCVLFYGIYIGAAINHFVPDVAQPIPADKVNCYAYYICQNTTNFAPESKFWYWYTGGFNLQIEHHLIPFVPVENLASLRVIVKDLCAKYNYPYIEFDSFMDMWNAHYKYLADLSLGTNSPAVTAEIANKHHYQGR